MLGSVQWNFFLHFARRFLQAALQADIIEIGGDRLLSRQYE